MIQILKTSTHTVLKCLGNAGNSLQEAVWGLLGFAQISEKGTKENCAGTNRPLHRAGLHRDDALVEC